jgi:hypothetical protein
MAPLKPKAMKIPVAKKNHRKISIKQMKHAKNGQYLL